ncbi:AAA family ATPase [Candidatus Uhrbacteria bacterium]|nr:AAA family ATPase [Candidatus Uhrbacteria bacterium]
MKSDTFIGNVPVLERLQDAVEHATLAHAYVFSGPSHVGKTTCALRLAAKIFATDRPEIHPDFLHVTQEADPKTGASRERIAIEQIQEICRRLSQQAFCGTKLLLIEDADLMSHAAQNALLKTLEEPRGRACIILTSSQPHKLLPTIHSRVHHVAFTRVSDDNLRLWLRERNISADKTERIVALADGCPGRAITCLENENALLEREADYALANRVLQSRVAERILAVHDMIPAYEVDHVKTRRLLGERVSVCEMVARRELLALCRASASGHETSLHTTSLARAVRAFWNVRKALDAHLDPHLSLIQAVLSF